MPLRDDRRGRRATIFSGTTPFRPEFLDRSAAEQLTASGSSEHAYEREILASSDDPIAYDASISSTDSRNNVAAVYESASVPVPESNCTPELAAEALPETLSVSAPAAPRAVRTTVLDPFAFLALLAQPFVFMRNAYVRFVYGTPSTAVSLETSTAETADQLAESTNARVELERDSSVIERSFASEFAALLGRQAMNRDPAAARSTGPSTAANASNERTVVSDHGSSDIATTSQPEPNEHRIVLRSTSPPSERAVPLTRLPLRPQEKEIAWIREMNLEELDATPSRAQRHALLERCLRDAGTLCGSVLQQAYRQEDLEGRTIALRALIRQYPGDGREIFIEALRIGSDEERALAIDGLMNIGARAELVPAFGDRIDAVAAKAALAYVGSRSRFEYRAELAPFVDDARIDRILALLAGIIE